MERGERDSWRREEGAGDEEREKAAGVAWTGVEATQAGDGDSGEREREREDDGFGPVQGKKKEKEKETGSRV